MCPSNCKRFWDRARYLWKNRHFIIPLAFDAPVRGVLVGISAPPLVRKNYNGVATRWWKNFEDMFIRFDVIHERDRRMDGQTDRHCVTAKTALASHRAVKWCGYPMVKKMRTYVYSFWHDPRTWKNRRFHVLQPTFLFPLETPLRLSRNSGNMLHGWKDNSVLAKLLAACTYSIVSELYRTMLKSMRKSKNRYFSTFLFSLGTPLRQLR